MGVRNERKQSREGSTLQTRPIELKFNSVSSCTFGEQSRARRHTKKISLAKGAPKLIVSYGSAV